MNPQRLLYLLEQHKRNQCTRQEQQELDAWYETLDDPFFVPKYVEGTPKAEAYVANHYQQFRERLTKKKRPVGFGLWAKIAAVLVVGFVIATLVWRSGSTTTEQLQPTNRPYAFDQEATDYNRYVTLPDGSVVLLSPGSRLELNRRFGKENRQLNLHGQAYFDVKHNASLPFVIQTGKVKTTVLGTAFNVKQVGDSVSVTVARGKVQVERDDKVLAVLVPGQQIATNDQTKVAELKKIDLEPVTVWMQEGLHFNNTRLADGVTQLQQRYGREIVLKTPGMENCTINIATPLSGTESLNNVLDVICTILGANYINNNGKIEITGEPCNRE